MIKNLIQRLFGITEIKQVDEDELIRKRNKLMLGVPIKHQYYANEVWESAYFKFRVDKISKHKEFYKNEGLFYANHQLEKYVRRLK